MMNAREFNIYEKEVEQARTVKMLGGAFLDKFFEEKSEQLFEAFKDCAIGDADGLEKIHAAYKSMNALQAEIQTVMNSGKLAQKSLDDD